MTTALTKPVSRVVSTRDGLDLVITLTQLGVLVREKGRRTEYGPLPYGSLRLRAAEITAQVTMSAPKVRKRKRMVRGAL